MLSITYQLRVGGTFVGFVDAMPVSGGVARRTLLDDGIAMRGGRRRRQPGHGHERRHDEKTGDGKCGVESVDVRVHVFSLTKQ